jgi:uncharacterized RDD family membrane protein YckC
MEYAKLPQRVLSFLLDLAILGALMSIVGAGVLAPLGMVAAVILGTRWDWSGYTFGMGSVIIGGLILLSFRLGVYKRGDTGTASVQVGARAERRLRSKS